MDLSARRKMASDHSRGSSHTRIYQRAITLVQKYARGGEFADFGAGQGEFVKSVNHLAIFARVSGIDLMTKPPDLPANIFWFTADLNEQTSFAPGSFDFISALEVIEHLENPRHTMRELFRLLKPGGMALVSTPNNESYRALISYFYRGHFVAFTDRSYPAHITPLNRKDLQRAATEAGFKVVSFAYTDDGCLPGVTRFTWQQISLGTLHGLRFSDNFYIILQR